MNIDVTGYKEQDACTFNDNYAELKRTAYTIYSHRYKGSTYSNLWKIVTVSLILCLDDFLYLSDKVIKPPQ